MYTCTHSCQRCTHHSDTQTTDGSIRAHMCTHMHTRPHAHMHNSPPWKGLGLFCPMDSWERGSGVTVRGRSRSPHAHLSPPTQARARSLFSVWGHEPQLPGNMVTSNCPLRLLTNPAPSLTLGGEGRDSQTLLCGGGGQGSPLHTPPKTPLHGRDIRNREDSLYP